MRFLLSLVLALSAISIASAEQDKPATGKSTADDKSKSKAADVIPGYKKQTIEGFTVLINTKVLEQDVSAYERKPVEVLELELKTIARLMPPRPLEVLRRVLIWVEWDQLEKMSNGRAGNALAIYYGGHQRHLLAEGKHPLKAKNVTILRMKELTAEHQPKRDSGRCVILHEIAHAVHDQLLGSENLPIKAAYKQAMERKLYEPNMYLSTNEAEYFAELTCAYFDQLDHYPKTRDDLKKHDLVAYNLMESVWGKRKDVGTKPGTGSQADLQVRLEKIDLGKPVVGAVPADLAGRAVMVVLWNAGSTSSQASLSKMNTWDAELSDFGVAMVAVHLTGTKKLEFEAAVQARNLSFAVTDAKWVEGSLVQDFKEFPLGLVFDHTGQCVFRGSPFDAEKALREAVGSALVARTNQETFPKAVAPFVEALQKGRAPTTLLPKLAPLLRSSDTETAEAAKLLVATMTEVGRKVLQETEPLLKEYPVAAFLKLERLPVVFKDSPVAFRANELLGRLKQDKGVLLELRARALLAAVKKLDSDLGSRPGSFNPALDDFRKDNALALAQLRETVLQMKKAWPKARATEEAVKIGEKFGLPVR